MAVIGGGNTAIDCAREAFRQGALEVTMITVEANPKDMPCVPEDLHDMLEEGVELLHGRAMTAVARQRASVEALELQPARFSRRHQRLADRRSTATAPAERFAADSVIVAVGQHAVARLAARGVQDRAQHDQDRRSSGGLATRTSSPPATSCRSGSGQPLMVVNAVGDGKRVAFNLDKVLRGEPLRARARCRSTSSSIWTA